MLRNMRLVATATQEVPEVPEEEGECTAGCGVSFTPAELEDLKNEAMSRFTKNEDNVARNWPDQSTKDPKVTLAMIVRDESEHIAECLESMKDHVDEIVIIDTGSKDNTIEICQSFGAKVFQYPWQDSFSVARNQAIDHVRTPWLIQMDADEMMLEADAKRVRDTVRSAHASTANLVYQILINKAKDEDEAMSVVKTGKIMRVIPTLKFTNRVHNRLNCPGDSRDSNLTIYHHGYSLPNEETMRKKKDRTTRLLKIQHAEQPEDPETSHYLAIQYLRMDEWKLAIQVGKQAVDLWKKYEPHSQLQLLSMYTTAMANYQLGCISKNREEQSEYFSEAIKYCKMALLEYPHYLDSNCLLSSIYFATKDHANCQIHAIRFLEAADMIKKDTSKTLVIPLMSMKHEWMVCLQLAINFFEQADADSAIKMIARSEALLPAEQQYKVTWGVFKYMISLGDPVSLKNAESIYMIGFRPDVK